MKLEKAFFIVFLLSGNVVSARKKNGDENFADASFFDGTDKKIDAGINLNSIKKNVKVNLHYVPHNGNGVENRYIKNNKYSGDYVVLGLQFII